MIETAVYDTKIYDREYRARAGVFAIVFLPQRDN